AFGDSIGAMNIAGGICAALLHRERTGEALVVDVSLLSSAIWAMGAGIAVALDSGIASRPPSSTQRMPVSNPLIGYSATKDDRFVMLTMLQGFEYWPDVCQRLGRPDLVEDERFATHEALTQNAGLAADILWQQVKEYTLDEVRDRFSGMRGQWCIVQDTIEIADDPQVVANGYLQEREHEGYRYRLAVPPVQFNEEPPMPGKSPDFNEHGDEILLEQLGLDWDTIVDLKVKGVVA